MKTWVGGWRDVSFSQPFEGEAQMYLPIPTNFPTNQLRYNIFRGFCAYPMQERAKQAFVFNSTTKKKGLGAQKVPLQNMDSFPCCTHTNQKRVI